jgi:hypothetical protein
MTSRSTSRDGGWLPLEYDTAASSRGSRRTFTLGIWALALGYFAFYAPYAALVRVTTTGAPQPIDGVAFRLGMVLAAGLATSVVMALTITFLGWWRYPGRRVLLGTSVPWPTRRTLLTGLATAAIIYATTLMYTFSGVSILLAMLLMRAGVLMLAPVVDSLFKRRVRWFSWTAFALSLLALAAVAAELPNYRLTWALAATVSVYIVAYAVRLHGMNSLAKSQDRNATCRYFVEEQLVAMAALIGVPVVMAVVGSSGMSEGIRHGFTAFASADALWPSLLIGLLYGSLYWFGTSVYLDRRENTFCISLNRCSSVLAAVVASYGLSFLAGHTGPNAGELTGAGLILSAMAVLSPLHHLRIARVPIGDSKSSGVLVFLRSHRAHAPAHYAVHATEK